MPLFEIPLDRVMPLNLEACLDGLINHLRGDLRFALLKAQIAQESAFDPFAKSPTGPVGLTQFTRVTWNDVMPGIDIAKRVDIYYAILAQVKYMDKLIKWAWTLAAPSDIEAFALAAYNAGQGNIRRCQLEANHRGTHPELWIDVRDCLPTIVGPQKAHETQGYVDRILSKAHQYEGDADGLAADILRRISVASSSHAEEPHATPV